MNQTEKRRAFIIKVVYIALWAAIIYVCLQYLMPLFMPFVIAFIITFILKPVIGKLVEKTGWKRRPVAITVLTLFYLLFGGLLVFGGIKLGVGIGNWLTNLPSYYTNTLEPAFTNFAAAINRTLGRLDPSVMEVVNNIIGNISQALGGFVTSISGQAVNMVSSVSWFVVGAFLLFIASYFLVVDYYKVTSFITKQFSPEARRKLFVVKDYVVGTLFNFVRAYAILMFITFVEVSIGLLILRVEGAIGIAALTALVDILPVFGTGTIMIPWIIYCFVTGEIARGVGLVVLYVIITVIRQVLEPRVVGRQIGLYPLLTLICMFIGTRLFGIWGLFGFPVALTVIVHLNRVGEIKLFKE